MIPRDEPQPGRPIRDFLLYSAGTGPNQEGESTITMTDLALWSQVLSAVAVLGKPVYLAIEIGQNTAAAHASTRLSAETAAITELDKIIG